MRSGATLLAVGAGLTLVLGAGSARAQTEAGSRDIFARYAPGVVQVQILEAGSDSKQSIGSGFAVEPAGVFVTNYHVVASVVQHPDRYRATLRVQDGSTYAATVVAFDVVQDLALVRSPEAPGRAFALHGGPALRKGERLFSLGNPLDLGMSVVEGTYNGLLEHSRYARIHFSGSLNPGMSGGPALLSGGEVAGVNVATAGDEVSFLVPVEHVGALLARARERGFEPPADLLTELRDQLLAQQSAYLADLLAQPLEEVRMGPYAAPTRLAPYFNCWGDAPVDEKAFFTQRVHACFTDDQVFVSEEQSFAIVELHHRQVTSTRISGRRFYALYSTLYENDYSKRWGRETDYTPFECDTHFVEHGGLTFKTSFCARRYKRLDGLYDVVFKAAALGRPSDGFETALLLSGVALDPARALSRRILESIRWAE
jgi:hypothetical protein